MYISKEGTFIALYKTLFFLVPPSLHYTLKLYDLELTWWRLFQKRVVCTNFDIYVFLIYYHWQSKLWGNGVTCQYRFSFRIWIMQWRI